MESTKTPLLGVSDFIALTNQTLDYALSNVAVEGEVSGFKVNQNKYVFFDLKDETGSIGCFMTVWQLRTALEDGMKVVVTATPKLTDWGKFSLTVRTVRPSGAGSIKRSFDLLKDKLDAEGLFKAERKRLLPEMPQRIAVISSTQAAGYADFITILNDRWGGLQIDVAHVQVQGKEAPDQIARALRYFNSREILPEIVVIIRGGGSLDDLSAFNDELLVREIARSRVPTVVGVGHETDTTLADLAADVRAATPSNAAQIIVPDRRDMVKHVRSQRDGAAVRLRKEVDLRRESLRRQLEGALSTIKRRYEESENQLGHRTRMLATLDPKRVLSRGYAIVRGDLKTGKTIEVETISHITTAEVTHVKNKA